MRHRAIYLLILLLSAVGWAWAEDPGQYSYEMKWLYPHQVRPDVEMLTRASLRLMAGEALDGEMSRLVDFPVPLQKRLEEDAFRYEGFYLKRVTLVALRQENAKQIDLQEALHFSDGLGRRCLVMARFRYHLTEKKIVVEEADLEPWYPETPQMRLYFLAADKVPKDLFSRFSNHAGLLEYLTENQLADTSTQKVFVFACSLDRLTAKDRLTLLVDDNWKDGQKTLRTNYAGWPVAMVRGQFDLRDPALTFDVYHTPGDYAPVKATNPVCRFIYGQGFTGPESVRPKKSSERRSVTIASASKGPSGSVALPLTLGNVSELGDMNMVVTYPPELLELTNFEKGALPEGTLLDHNQEAGKLQLGLLHGKGITTERLALGRLDFKLLGSTGSEAAITTVVSSATEAGSETPLRFETTTAVVRTAENSTPGDWNGDQKVTSLDALAALKMSVSKLPEDKNLDLDRDGRVTARDARLLLQMAVDGGSGVSPPEASPPKATAEPEKLSLTATATANPTATPSATPTPTPPRIASPTPAKVSLETPKQEFYGRLVDGFEAVGQAVWSDDSRYLLIPSGSLVRFEPASKETRFLITEDAEILGKKVVRSTGDKLLVSGPRVFYHPVPESQVFSGNVYAELSLEGGKPVAYSSTPLGTAPVAVRGDQALVRKASESGASETLLTTRGDPPNFESLESFATIRGARFCDISRDWTRLVTADNYGGDEPSNWKVLTVSGEVLAQFPPSRGLLQISLSPDGQHAVAVEKNGNQQRLVVIPLGEPSRSHLIHQGAAEYSKPAWSPDGKRVASCALVDVEQMEVDQENRLLIVRVAP